MAPVSAHDVAAELRRARPSLGVTQVQKLLYYAQGWHLAWTGEPLFYERIEAWPMGPVVAELWRAEKYERPKPWPTNLNGEQMAVVDRVVARYGHLGAQQLKDMTHEAAPWRDVFHSSDEITRMLQTIPEPAMTEWFRRDPEYIAHQESVEKLRRRPDVYNLTPPPFTAGELEAIERAIRGERVDDRAR